MRCRPGASSSLQLLYITACFVKVTQCKMDRVIFLQKPLFQPCARVSEKAVVERMHNVVIAGGGEGRMRFLRIGLSVRNVHISTSWNRE